MLGLRRFDGSADFHPLRLQIRRVSLQIGAPHDEFGLERICREFGLRQGALSGDCRNARLDLLQLHRIDPKVPREEQFGLLKDLLDEGKVASVGLSEVTVEELEAARQIVPIATVQNRYNLIDRTSEDVLDYCAKHGVGFIPWFPLAAGDLAKPGTALDAIVHKTGATPSQVALAWVLKRSPVMLPIPGTGKVAHLEDNVRAAAIELSDADFGALDAQARQAA